MSEVNELKARIKELEDRINVLQNVCGEAYQLAGCFNKSPIEALDNLLAAAQGEPIPHETFLPIEFNVEKDGEGAEHF